MAKVKEIPPEFTSQIRDLNVRVGEPATFDCQITGYPRPDVAWIKASLHVLALFQHHYKMKMYSYYNAVSNALKTGWKTTGRESAVEDYCGGDALHAAHLRSETRRWRTL